MYDFNKALKNGKSKHLSFPGTTSKPLLQYLDVNLKIHTAETDLIYAKVNNVLNDKSQSNTENLWLILNTSSISVANSCEKYINI